MANADIENPSTVGSSAQVEAKLYTPPNPHQVLRIALNLKSLLDSIIPNAVPISSLLNILTPRIVDLALQACGGKGNGEIGTSSRKYRGCVIYCLIIVSTWYDKLSQMNLHESDLYQCRSAASEHLAKLIIESHNLKDQNFLFIQMLCRRYTIVLNEEVTSPTSALELAVDKHSIVIISSSGYQRCMKWLWRGWIIQARSDPQTYIMYKDVNNSRFLSHFNPNRIKSPQFQNIMEIMVSIVYLILFTYLINNHDKKPDGAEIIFTCSPSVFLSMKW